MDTFVEITVSSRKTSKQRRIEEVLHMLTNTDTLVVTELSRLGRSTAEVIALVNELVARNVWVIILKQNLDVSQHDMTSKFVITLFSLFAELECDLMSLRTKEALAAKKCPLDTLALSYLLAIATYRFHGRTNSFTTQGPSSPQQTGFFILVKGPKVTTSADKIGM